MAVNTNLSGRFLQNIVIVEKELGDISADDGTVLPQEEEEVLPEKHVGSMISQQIGTFCRFADLLLTEIDHLQLVSLSRNQRTYTATTTTTTTKSSIFLF